VFGGPSAGAPMQGADEEVELVVVVTGAGEVTGPGIACTQGGNEEECTETYSIVGQEITLTAKDQDGELPKDMFTHWGDACDSSGKSRDCKLKLDNDATVSAIFVRHEPLTVSAGENGSVKGTDFTCPPSCALGYPTGTEVQLTAEAASGYRLLGWEGSCASFGTDPSCTVTMDSPRSAIAKFAVGRELVVTVTGTGAGTVTGSGIDCPGRCSLGFAPDVEVTLTAAATGDSNFTGWGGACARTSGSACTLTMDASKAVSAQFTATPPPPPQCSDGRDNDGDGRIDSPTDPGCASPTDDDETDPVVPPVTIAPMPGEMVQEKPIPTHESASIDIKGMGDVTGADRVLSGAGSRTAEGAINCGPDHYACFAEFDPDTTITLTAHPAEGYVLDSWTGACAGTSRTCTLSLSESRTVTAHFTPRGGQVVESNLAAPLFRGIRWSDSVGRGSLVLRGAVGKAADIRLQVRRPAGGPLLTRRVAVRRGSFRQTKILGPDAFEKGARLFPGGFVVSLTGASAGGVPVLLQIRTVELVAPAEGVVRKTWASATPNGAVARSLPATTKLAYVHFVFAKGARPKETLPLEVRWYEPNGRLAGTFKVNNRPDIHNGVRSPQFPRGVWVAELRAGGKIVKRVRVAIGT
jgi:hypothetical protein